MGIRSLNNGFNIVALWKTMKAGQTAKTVAPSQPVELTKNGSIFNVQNSQKTLNSQKTQSQRPVNTQNSQSQPTGYSIGEGQEKAASAKAMMAQAKAGKAETERNSSIMGKVSAQSKNLQANTQASEKAMQAAMRSGQEQIDKNNAKMQKLTADLMREKAEIDAIQTRLEALTGGGITGSGGSVYSLKLAGETDPAYNSSGSGGVNSSGGGGSGNNSEIESLVDQLGSKQAKITVYSGKMNKIQTSSGKAVRTMSKASHNYQKTVKQNQVQAQQYESTATKVANVTDVINGVAMMTMLAGQGLELFGKGMRDLGEQMVSSQNPATAAVGAAMITASVPIQETGSVVQTVGSYASTAASVTKSICQVADGDIGGAMQSIMAATTTVAAAIQGTVTMKDGFEGIKKSAQEAMQSGVEKQVAKKLYKQNKDEMKAAGFTNKQIKQMAYQQTAGKMSGADMNELKAQLKANKGNEKGTTISSAQNLASAGDANMKGAKNLLNSTKQSIGEAIPSGTKNRDKAVKKAEKYAASQIASNPTQATASAALDAVKSSYGSTGDAKKSIAKFTSSSKKADTILKSIGATFMAAGMVGGLATAFSQSSDSKDIGKEKVKEHKELNINVKHSYMKELAHMRKMARQEAMAQRLGR